MLCWIHMISLNRIKDFFYRFFFNAAQLGLLEFSLLRCQLQKRVTQSEVMQSDFLPTLNMKRADSKSYV
ncbi:hypothetical protein D918_07264 [Trichuris suis]|nr:hypothetical protein D918_07264 [Trichuris suis]